MKFIEFLKTITAFSLFSMGAYEDEEDGDAFLKIDFCCVTHGEDEDKSLFTLELGEDHLHLELFFLEII
jgi:hypothetical protein